MHIFSTLVFNTKKRIMAYATKLIHFFLIIERPKVVTYLPKENVNNIIDNFLHLSPNGIQTTAKNLVPMADIPKLRHLFQVF